MQQHIIIYRNIAYYEGGRKERGLCPFHMYIYILNIIIPLMCGIGCSCRYAYPIDGIYNGALLDQRSHGFLVPALARAHQHCSTPLQASTRKV